MGVGVGMAGAQAGIASGSAPAGASPAGGQGGGASAGGGPSAQGAPVDPVQAVISQIPLSGTQGVTPQDLENAAQTIAQQIFQMSPQDRNKTLREVKKRNEGVHALVKSMLSKLDQQAAQQGKQLAQQSANQQSQQAGNFAPKP